MGIETTTGRTGRRRGVRLPAIGVEFLYCHHRLARPSPKTKRLVFASFFNTNEAEMEAILPIWRQFRRERPSPPAVSTACGGGSKARVTSAPHPYSNSEGSNKESPRHSPRQPWDCSSAGMGLWSSPLNCGASMNRGRAAAEPPTPGLRGIPGRLRRTISDERRPRTLISEEWNGCINVFSDAMGTHGFDRATATAECPSFSVEASRLNAGLGSHQFSAA